MSCNCRARDTRCARMGKHEMFERFRSWVLTPVGLTATVTALAAFLSIPILSRDLSLLSWDLWRWMVDRPTHHVPPLAVRLPSPSKIASQNARSDSKPAGASDHATIQGGAYYGDNHYGYYLERRAVQGDVSRTPKHSRPKRREWNAWDRDGQYVDTWKKCVPPSMPMPCYYEKRYRAQMPQYRYD
jgi:hypothetical protein